MPVSTCSLEKYKPVDSTSLAWGLVPERRHVQNSHEPWNIIRQNKHKEKDSFLGVCFWCHFFTILDKPLLLERETACCPIATSCDPLDAVENLVAQEGQRAWVACSNLPLDLHRVAAIEKLSGLGKALCWRRFEGKGSGVPNLVLVAASVGNYTGSGATKGQRGVH